MPKNALVIGMPRSGTSLTANVLAGKGYYVGTSRLSSLQHGDNHNPFGYFEADDVVERNVRFPSCRLPLPEHMAVRPVGFRRARDLGAPPD